MSKSKQLSLKVRSIIGVASLVLVLSGLNLFTFKILRGYLSNLSNMIEVTIVANQLKALSGTVTEGLPFDIEEYALHPGAESEAKINETFSKIKIDLDKLNSMVVDQDARTQLELVKNMLVSSGEKFKIVKEKVEAKAPTAEVNDLITEIKDSSTLVAESIQSLISAELSYDQTIKIKLEKSADKTGMAVLVIIVVSAVSGFLLIYIYLMKRNILNPLEKMRETMDKIANNASDINLRVEIHNYDEIGLLAEYFNKMADTIQKYNEHLEETINLRTMQLKEQVQTVTNLLDNMKQAVFSVSADGKIMAPVSKFSENVFGDTILDKNVFNTVFKDIDPKSEMYSALNSAMISVYGETDLQWMLSEDNFPKQVYFNKEDDKRILKLSYNPLYDDSGAINKVLFVIDDITNVIRLEKIQKENEKNSLVVQELAGVEPKQLEEYFKNTLILLEDCKDSIKNTAELKEKFPVLLRNLHTIKGNSRIFGLSFISSVTHDVETNVLEKKPDIEMLNSQLQSDLTSELSAELLKIEAEIYQYARVAKRVFRIENELETIQFSELVNKLVVLNNYLEVDYLSEDFFEFQGNLKGLQKNLTTLGKEIEANRLQEIAQSLKNKNDLTTSSFKNDWNNFNDEILPYLLSYPSVISSDIKSIDRWVPLFLSYAKMNRAINSNSDIKQKIKEITQEIELLKSNFILKNVEFEYQIINYLQMIAEQNTSEEIKIKNLEKHINSFGSYLKLVSQINIEASMTKSTRDNFIKFLESLPKDKSDLENTLELFKSRSCYLLSSLRAMCRNNIGLSDFLSNSNWKEWTVLSNALPDLKEFLLAILSSNDLKLESYCPSLFNQSDSSKPHFNFLKKLSISKILKAYLGSNSTNANYNTIEIVDFRFNQLKQEVAKFSANKEQSHVDNLIHIFNRVLDVPLVPALARFSTMVDELSVKLGKKVNFKVYGEDVFIKRDLLYPISDALVHVVRNSLDHGLETPEARKKAGKVESGTIEINCSESDNVLTFTISDDGAGIDGEKVAKVALDKGLITSEQLKKLEYKDKMNLIFLPGISTKEQVTDLSGRGVGMDVLARNIEQINGRIKLESTLGRGTELKIEISI